MYQRREYLLASVVINQWHQVDFYSTEKYFTSFRQLRELLRASETVLFITTRTYHQMSEEKANARYPSLYNEIGHYAKRCW